MNVYTTPFGHLSYALIVGNKKAVRFIREDAEDANHFPFGVTLDSLGSCNRYSRKSGGVMCLIALDKNLSREDVIDVLVHECVHVFQFIKEEMGEEVASDEFEAYSIQRIFKDLYNELKGMKYGGEEGSREAYEV